MSRITNGDLLSQFKEAQENLKYYKKLEAELREKVVERFSQNQTKKTETYNKSGFQFKITKGFNISVDSEQLNGMWNHLTEEEQECFEYVPKFKKSIYNKLEDTSNVDEVLTSKPSMPTVAISEINGD